MAFEVMKGLIPPDTDNKVYNFEDLNEAGDMLFVPWEDTTEALNVLKNRVQAAATSYGKRRSIKLTARACSIPGKGEGVGVWRMN